ncbi:hypothetical protein E2C01_014112 [Portunus trituberculatus]|uniref:Uncharacterized protein n=1 Tax=Portunus trituberculatus TaxID=210409 RepID=A0A5B7DJB9_PORTR|nr:hypothetical protein [Portunus trituberculatus]
MAATKEAGRPGGVCGVREEAAPVADEWLLKNTTKHRTESAGVSGGVPASAHGGSAVAGSIKALLNPTRQPAFRSVFLAALVVTLALPLPRRRLCRSRARDSRL